MLCDTRSKFLYVNGVLVYNAWDNDFDIIRKGNFLTLFKEQMVLENISIPALCIFDCTNEGVGASDIGNMVNAITTCFTTEVRVLFNVVTNHHSTYEYKCFPTHMVAHCQFLRHVNSLNINWDDIVVDRYFLSLQRRASLSRVKFTKMLLDTFDENQYIISCASQPDAWMHKSNAISDAFHPRTLPVLVDGVVDGDDKQHHHTNESFFKCLINIISETSSQTDDDSWRDIFITEKTFKAFAYRQLPLWFAVPRTVAVVRDMGFDVFDDIINHSYDYEEDETVRMKMVVDELRTFLNNYTYDVMNSLRTQLWNRINKNMELLTKLESTHNIIKNKLILELIK